MMRFHLLAVALLACLVVAPEPARACTCAEPSGDEAVQAARQTSEHAPLIIDGTVVAPMVLTPTKFAPALVRVDRVWKGHRVSEVWVGDISDCEPVLKTGSRLFMLPIYKSSKASNLSRRARLSLLLKGDVWARLRFLFTSPQVYRFSGCSTPDVDRELETLLRERAGQKR